MRNVSIWTNEEDWEHLTTPVCIRLFQYKGVKNTLNEFLSPNYILRGINLAPRQLDNPGRCSFFDDKLKGQVVLMGYNSISRAEEGNGEPYKVFPSFERAVHWLIKNGYEFYGYESTTKRARKAKAMDFDAENMKYQAMAREYEKFLGEPPVVKNVVVHPATRPNHQVNITVAGKQVGAVPPVPPIPPASRVLNDLGAPVGGDPELPPILQYPPKVSTPRKSFFRRVMDFLTK